MQPSPYLTALLLASAALALSACKQPAPVLPVAAIDQSELCQVKGWQYDNAVAAGCKSGQKIVYLPDSWGNEQLPIYFAAVNCDMRYAVAMTHGGVACIYAPTTPSKAAAAK